MRKRVIVYPSIEKSTNFYIRNLYKTIKKDYNVVGYNEIKEKIGKLKGDIYHFNWIESINQKKDYLKKKILIILLKLLNKKIIWTVHNNMPHEIKDQKQTIDFMKFMAKKADRVHVLCKETVNSEYLKKYREKIVYIPHGDYIGNYAKSRVDIHERYKIDKEKKIILFIGQVRKYKNIELLIKVFKNSYIENNNCVLLICGNCNDEEYKKELQEISTPNVFFDFKFIKDEEMESYLRNSEIIVAPYNKQSSLNSGTLWMAMSYKKTMMLPLIGCVKDIRNYDDFLYVYDYNNQDDHYQKLLNCMRKLNSDMKNNEKNLLEKGNLAYKYILNSQSWKKQSKDWINLYKF